MSVITLTSRRSPQSYYFTCHVDPLVLAEVGDRPVQINSPVSSISVGLWSEQRLESILDISSFFSWVGDFNADAWMNDIEKIVMIKSLSVGATLNLERALQEAECVFWKPNLCPDDAQAWKRCNSEKEVHASQSVESKKVSEKMGPSICSLSEQQRRRSSRDLRSSEVWENKRGCAVRQSYGPKIIPYIQLFVWSDFGQLGLISNLDLIWPFAETIQTGFHTKRL